MRFERCYIIAGSLVLALAAPCGLLLSDDESPADDAPKSTPLSTGRQAGDLVPSFYSRVVTGPLMNKSVCFVCRNGTRPVVMVVARQLSGDLQALLRGVDGIVDKHRAEGLRSFCVLVSDEPARDASHVQTFAFDGMISLPITVATPAVAGEACLNLAGEAEVTVVLYRQQKVVESFAFRAGELDGQGSRRVLRAVEQFIRTDADGSTKATAARPADPAE